MRVSDKIPANIGKEREITHEVKETVNLSLSLSSKVGSFDTVHNPSTNLLGIPYFLEEASVLLDSLDTESLVLSSDSVNEVIVGDFGSSDFSLDLRVVCREKFGCSTSKREELRNEKNSPRNRTVFFSGSTS